MNVIIDSTWSIDPAVHLFEYATLLVVSAMIFGKLSRSVVLNMAEKKAKIRLQRIEIASTSDLFRISNLRPLEKSLRFPKKLLRVNFGPSSHFHLLLHALSPGAPEVKQRTINKKILLA